MVFGIGEGKIDLHLEKDFFAPGESIRGKVGLKLDNPKEANALRIRFKGEYVTGSGKNRHTVTLYEKELMLDEKKLYPMGARYYDFEFQIPPRPQEHEVPKVSLGPLSFNLGETEIGRYRRATWHLDASLDISMSLDINNRKVLRINW